MVENNNKPTASPVPVLALPVVESQSINSSRRRFIFGALGAAVLAASVSAPVWYKIKSVFAAVQPVVADLELAELGIGFRNSNRGMAQQLEAFARHAAGLAPAAHIDWEAALAARTLLTEHNRVQQEYGRGDTVYVEGWLLSHSEMGLALLFAVANANSTITRDNTPDSQSPAPGK